MQAIEDGIIGSNEWFEVLPRGLSGNGRWHRPRTARIRFIGRENRDERRSDERHILEIVGERPWRSPSKKDGGESP
jgi:hypothetical protein